METESHGRKKFAKNHQLNKSKTYEGGVRVCEHPINSRVYNMVVSQTNGFASRHPNRNCDAYKSYKMVR